MIEELHKAHECSPGGIRTINQLRFHLQIAMQLELSTVPPYLCALYSLRDGHNEIAAQVIRSVVMEEMLHIALVGNVLNAIGGKVELTKHVPSYPTKLPHSNGAFTVSLRKFSRAAIQTFLDIERPEKKRARPEAEDYKTIGQFYQAIQKGLRRVCGETNRHFVKKAAGENAQIFPRQYYGSIGSAFPVSDLPTALRALQQIVNQGEGVSDTLFTSKRRTRLAVDGRELAHYYRFQQIELRRLYRVGDKINHPIGAPLEIDWDAVYQMEENPRAEDFPVGSEIRGKMDEFNRSYMRLLESVEQSLSGQPANLMASVGSMYELKYRAVELMKIPRGDGAGMAGPSFEFIEAAREAAA